MAPAARDAGVNRDAQANRAVQPSRDGRSVRAEQRRQATREGLIAAARTLLGERGVSGTTLDLIAEHAKVARATVYLHFETKGDVIGAVVDDLVGRLELAVKGVDLQDGAAPPEDQLAANLLRVLHVLFAHQRLTRALFDPDGDEAAGSARAQHFLQTVQRMLRDALVDGAAVGLVRRDFDVGVAALALFGAVREVTLRAELGDHDDIDRRMAIARTLVSVCLCGVAEDPLRAAVRDGDRLADELAAAT